MKKIIKTRFYFLLFTILLLPIESCKKEDVDLIDPNNGNGLVIPEIELEGILQIEEGTTIQASELQIISFTDSKELSDNGSFSLNIPETNKNQLLFFNSSDNEPVYIGIYNPTKKEIMASEKSTALALTMFNPYLIYSNQSQREDYINRVQQNSKFDELVNELHTAYITDAKNALNYEENPIVYQLIVQITKETLESFNSYNKSINEIGNPPYIEDVAGPNIKFVNNRHVWYAAGIYTNTDQFKGIQTVNRKETILTFNLGWPPISITDPAETDYELGDGSFRIHIARGFKFSKFNDWNDPAGRGTVYNTAQSLLYIIDLIIGFVPMPDIGSLPNHFHVSANDALALSKDIALGDSQAFLIHFFKLIGSNKEELAYWIFQETGHNATAHFIKAASGILQNVALVFKILGLANEQAPYIWDVVFAPNDVTYFITQEAGVIISSTQNDPPIAEYTINPPTGIIGTEFMFDASNTTDDNDILSQIQFRWDFEGNGNWSSWSNNYISEYNYTESGSYNILLEAKDTDGQIGAVSHVLNIGGGAGTANHVKLFMDELPWNTDAMEQMLINLGFTQGIGENKYEIITSDQMNSVELIPGFDLVIISNDQPQNFYYNYSSNQVKFTNFVYSGGSIFWEACDNGWNDGLISNTGITFPGNISTNYQNDKFNYITNESLPLVYGLPFEMDHNYASHEYFSNLLDGTIVYCVNSNSKPTLIEFNLGDGWMLMTGQPLEHQYIYIHGNNDMEELLPRIVGYFTNRIPSEHQRSLKKSIKPTSLK